MTRQTGNYEVEMQLVNLGLLLKPEETADGPTIPISNLPDERRRPAWITIAPNLGNKADSRGFRPRNT